MTTTPFTTTARATPISARGESMVWLTGMSLALCLVMIIGLLSIVIVQGGRAFWPRPIDAVKLRDGGIMLAVPIRDEVYTPAPDEEAAVQAARTAADTLSGAFDSQGRPKRRLYRVANREFRPQPFAWVPIHTIQSIERDKNAAYLERLAWGVWIGLPTSLFVDEPIPASASERGSLAASLPTELAPVRTEEIEKQGGAKVTRLILAEGPEATTDAIRLLHADAIDRRDRIEYLKEVRIGRVNHALERERLKLRSVEIRAAPPGMEHDRPPALGPAGFVLTTVGVLLLLAGGIRHFRRSTGHTRRALGRPVAAGAAIIAGLALALFVWLENPWASRSATEAELTAALQAFQQADADLQKQYEAIRAEIDALEEMDARFRVVITDPSNGRFAPTRQTEPDDPMRLSQIARMVQPNDLGFFGRLGVYAGRWVEFITDEPRDANTEGGIFPVIFGTVVLTLLLSVAVVPLGVIAALYLREYATQGFLTSLVRIGVNNLAGVPSIVYGVFGLGFFCYSVGGYVDAGPSRPLPVSSWWLLIIGLCAAALAAFVLGILARPAEGGGSHRGTAGRWAGRVAFCLWLVCAGLALYAIAGTPYFDGFFSERLPNPTFGSKGILWASLTLALLTLPVVIVATEEAISAVPRSMREGSYGCGASKWQTVRRIVLPRAMPGIMTGMILAMARGAGEVAPLMLVGAAKSASQLVVSANFPFIHLERSFMHLGFHIFDVGLQSPDSEAARPLVWCTTLVLILIVVLLTLSAIHVRSGLRRKYLGESF